MLDYMPADTVYLTSLRAPESQLLSAYKYFSAAHCFNLTFEEFLNKHEKTAEFVGKCSHYYKWWLMNGQSYDLGLDTADLSPSNPEHKELVQAKISEVDRRFALVLILDRLDESLIVMRDLLNWTTQDLIYFRKNFQLSNETVPAYTALQKSLAREWNWADDLTYSYFSKKLAAIVDRNPRYYEREVGALRNVSSLWFSRCVSEMVPAARADNSHMSTGYASTIGTYKLTPLGKLNDRCIQLTISEVARVRLLNAGSPIDAQVYKQGEISNDAKV